MAENTKIQWTESSWNPLLALNDDGKRGWFCVHASEGCRNCYAEALNKRLGNGLDYKAQNMPKVRTELSLSGQSSIDWPLRKKDPQRIFVCSMTDLFGEFVRDDLIDRVLHVIDHARQHTFQILTKRADRMRRSVIKKFGDRPPPNAWFGVSCEDQKTADERIPLLLQTPAAVRFVSYEPALGPIEFCDFFPEWDYRGEYEYYQILTGIKGKQLVRPGIDWLIVGGESGPGARPFDLAWARRTVEQCREAGCAVFVKQIGSNPVDGYPDRLYRPHGRPLTDKKGGNWDEWPQDLRVREYPA